MLSLIAAIDNERNIGKDGQLLWHIPKDLKRFKTLTMGKPIIMGRKTYDSIGKPLPGRKNIIITTQDLIINGATVVHSLEQAISEAKEEKPEEIFIIGGQKIYELALPVADKLYLTLVHGSFLGDTKFPDYSKFGKIVSEIEESDDNYKFTFLEIKK